MKDEIGQVREKMALGAKLFLRLGGDDRVKFSLFEIVDRALLKGEKGRGNEGALSGKRAEEAGQFFWRRRAVPEEDRCATELTYLVFQSFQSVGLRGRSGGHDDRGPPQAGHQVIPDETDAALLRKRIEGENPIDLAFCALPPRLPRRNASSSSFAPLPIDAGASSP